MPNTNTDVIAKYTGVRRALMNAKHSKPQTGLINKTIAELDSYLQRPMRVVILGEHNSGKTALINAMLGQELLPTAVIANTPVSVTMRFGTLTTIKAQTGCGTWHDIDRNRPFESFDPQNLQAVEVRAPNPLLKRFEFVDTPPSADPGSNIPGADLVIWCTNASRAWSESERRAWMALPRRCRRHGILAVTHMETLVSITDRNKVLQRLHTEADDLFNDIKLLDSAACSNTAANGPHDGDGIKALLQCLKHISKQQRERRSQAAHKIAKRLTRVVATARNFPPPLPAQTQMAN